MPTNTNAISTDTNITTAPFPFPIETTAEVAPETLTTEVTLEEVKPEQTVESIAEMAKPTTIQKTSMFIQEKKDKLVAIFPKTLESNGYIILSGVVLIFSLALLICARRLNKLIAITREKNTLLQKDLQEKNEILQEKNEIFQDITISLYAQQQVIEYRLLLSDLNTANSTIEKTNARTQLYNFLNIICLEICTTKNPYLALQLATSFFTKIQTRYIKLSPLPGGIVYFKHIGKILTETKDILDEQMLIQKIQTDFINIHNPENEVIKEEIIIPIIDNSTNETSWFSSNKK